MVKRLFRLSRIRNFAILGIALLLLMIILPSVLYYMTVLRIHYSGAIFKPVQPYNRRSDVYIKPLDKKDSHTDITQHDVRHRIPRILFWPNSQAAKTKLWNLNCMKTCPVECDVTFNTSDIENVDAVEFMLTELWPDNWSIGTKQTIQFPSYRRQDQVWIVSNLEPPSNLFGDLQVFNGIFNWTVWYRTDATIYHPYGRYEEKHLPENADVELKLDVRNVFKEKNYGIAGFISNCKDVSRRYRFIDEFSTYVNMTMYGKCYKNVCGDPAVYSSCENVMKTYKFYLALENTYCKDYVTEKYWGALSRDQIPIVNWNLNNINKNVPIPGSYISVHDFGSIQELAEYIKNVNTNESLYNSYFDWKKKYTLGRVDCKTCAICKKLHERIRPQVFEDFDGWVRNDVCKKVDSQNYKETVLSEYLFWTLGI